MKKLVAVLFALALVAMLPLSALAATGINQYEQTVLDKLATCSITDDSGKVVSIPQEYINAARNYFLGDFEMTEEQMNTVLAKISQSMAVVEEDAAKQSLLSDGFKISSLDEATREQVLNLGKEACEQIGLSMSYNLQDKQMTITSSSTNSTVFVSSSVIKTTGEDFPVTAGTVLVSAAIVLAMGTAIIFGVSKKAGLLVK